MSESETIAKPFEQRQNSQKSGTAFIALLWALGLAGFLVNADNRAIAPVLPAIAADLHIRESTAGLLISAYAIPYGLFQLVYGPLSDRIGKARTITIALSLFAIGTVGCGLVGSFQWLFLLRIITGVFAAGIIPIALAQIGDSFSFSERPKAISFFMSLSTSGQALGIVVGAMLAQFISWKVLFFLIGIGGLPAVYLFLKQQPQSVSKVKSVPLVAVYRKLFAMKRTWIVYGTVFLEGAVFFGGFTYLGVYANRNLGMNYFAIGLITALYSLSALVGSRFITAVLKKVGQPNMPLFGAAILTAASLCIWLSTTILALGIGFVLFGIGYSFAHSTLQTYATELMPEARGTSMSLFAFFLFVGTGAGPVWLGYLYDGYGASGMLAASVGSFVLFALVCGTLLRKSVKN